ncbi:MAG TPA: SET domain-containing protein-lysine N-methyltransferase, partial [Bacillota bacterium]|nr:SET domain-containing protein-lysine N-methyltransferase [Bacillota bacterium]
MEEVRQQPDAGGETPVAETEWVIFRKSRIHGTGGFARRDIPKDTRIIEYLGEKIDKRESLRRCEQNNEYIFTLNESE